MSAIKELQMSRDEILDSCQKLVLSGRCMLDAIEELCGLFMKQSARTESPGTEKTKAAGQPDGATAEITEQPVQEDNRVQEAGTAEKAARINTAEQEQVRGQLAELAGKGYRAEVKALLTRHGAAKLSDITDPEDLAQLMEEAKQIGGPT